MQVVMRKMASPPTYLSTAVEVPHAFVLFTARSATDWTSAIRCLCSTRSPSPVGIDGNPITTMPQLFPIASSQSADNLASMSATALNMSASTSHFSGIDGGDHLRPAPVEMFEMHRARSMSIYDLGVEDEDDDGEKVMAVSVTRQLAFGASG